MKRIKSMLALLLAALMTLTLLPVTAAAESAAQTEEQAAESSVSPVRGSVPRFTTLDAAADYVRSQMIAHQESFSLSIPVSLAEVKDGTLVAPNLTMAALEHVKGGPSAGGDYLRSTFKSSSSSINISDDYRDLIYTYSNVTYGITAQQEATLTAEISEALASLKLSGKTEEQKFRAIYDYICDRVNYDYEHLNDSSYDLKYTAYAAMHNRTAVCQGYAMLLYRMCMEAGLDARVVSGVAVVRGSEIAHAWNIVRIGGVYYNVDATWDGQDDETTHNWYLMGMRNFRRHYREYSCAEEAFDLAQPMALDPALALANNMTTLPGVSGDAVSAAASGKPLLVVFGAIGNERTESVMNYLSKCDLSGLDVVYADCGDSTANEVKSAMSAAASAGVKLCWNEDDKCLNAMVNALRGDYDKAPVILYIDKSNTIRSFSFYITNNCVLKANVEGYLGLTLAPAKPTVTTQPKSQTVSAGTTVKFTVAARGDELTYRWQYKTPDGSWKNSGSTGHATATLTIEATAARNGYQYRCVVENAGGKAISKAATLTVAAKPAVTAQPANKTACVGDSVKFTVSASGSDLTYRWQYRTSSTGTWKNSTLTGCATPALTVSATTSRNGYQYRCVVENGVGKAISKAATLTVKPKITTQPADRSGYVGDTAKFTVAAKGDGLTYRWQYYTGSAWKDSGLTGHATATLSVGVTAARNGQQYRCVVTDKNGTKSISSTAKLIVKPRITSQPSNKSTTAGTAVKFTVQATGAGLTYRWQYRTSSTGSWKNSGATGCSTATLTVTPSTGMNGYQYRCVIVDANGTKLISSAATLTVK